MVVVIAGIVERRPSGIAVGLGRARVTVINLDVDRLRMLDDLSTGRIATCAPPPPSSGRSWRQTWSSARCWSLAHGRPAISRNLVERMQPGSVIVDVAVDQGGCCETTTPTTHPNPVYGVNGVVHIASPICRDRAAYLDESVDQCDLPPARLASEGVERAILVGPGDGQRGKRDARYNYVSGSGRISRLAFTPSCKTIRFRFRSPVGRSAAW